MPPRLNGILETCLYVDEVGRARGFYEGILGLQPMLVEERLVVYGIGAAAVLILFRRGGTLEPVDVPGQGTIPPHDGSGPQHIALAISGSEVDGWREHLAGHAVEIEGEVAWEKGSHSLYFRDPDGHLVELASPGLWDNY